MKKFYRVVQFWEGGDSVYGYFKDEEKARECADHLNKENPSKIYPMEVEECEFSD